MSANDVSVFVILVTVCDGQLGKALRAEALEVFEASILSREDCEMVKPVTTLCASDSY